MASKQAIRASARTTVTIAMNRDASAMSSPRSRTNLRKLACACWIGGSDYAEIGAVTNLASRLADEATPGPDPDLPAPLAEVEDDVEVGPVGEFTLKGFQRPVQAFNVVAVRENVELRLSQADPQYANLQGLLRERRDSNPRPPA